MSRFCQQIGWEDVPHLTERQKAEYLDTVPLHQRDARTKGYPVLGAGVIYPVEEEAVICEPFDIPPYWPRAYGMDADWNRTAAVWGAWDRESDIVYIYSEYFGRQQPPSVHADAIKRRGAWMTGAMDPSMHGKLNTRDGKKLSAEYLDLGLFLVDADNAVEAGIFAVYQRLAAGRLKIFKTCVNLRRERRIYRRDENGKVVKSEDDLMDAERYLIMTGMLHATIEPQDYDDFNADMANHDRSEVTGY